jgi:hypothetical protein
VPEHGGHERRAYGGAVDGLHRRDGLGWRQPVQAVHDEGGEGEEHTAGGAAGDGRQHGQVLDRRRHRTSAWSCGVQISVAAAARA